MAMDPNIGPALPPELMGEPAPEDAGAGLPPELMALLGGGGALPEEEPAEEAPADESPVSLIQQMIDAAKRYMEVEPDEEDKLTMSKVLTQLQQYLAKDQSEGEEMLAGKISPRAIRRAGVGG